VGGIFIIASAALTLTPAAAISFWLGVSVTSASSEWLVMLGMSSRSFDNDFLEFSLDLAGVLKFAGIGGTGGIYSQF
jgi:hypothetical protein